ncbi:unnamed protein product [Calicophoron daubneyi]|uniref:CSD domain-containing protein n=1 Tax=Calicophoron daubneyi TaxID=300641 RepID=A0AAV2T1U7_CALDB
MAAVVETPNEVTKPPKKEVEIIKVLAEKVRGHVKWYSATRRYGFISRNDDGGDLFVHRSVISSYSRRYPSLRNGEEVEFSVVETNQGIEATLVTGPDGQPVKGLRPFSRRYRTVSEPNRETDASNPPADPAGGDASRPRQSGRRYRGPRRRGGGRIRSAGTAENQCVDGEQEHDMEKIEGAETDGTQDKVDGESPNDAVPRQRRRPQRRSNRNRSAPTENEGAADIQGNGTNESHDAQAVTGGNDQRPQPRRFRRPFRQRGGSYRYMNGYTNGQQGYNDLSAAYQYGPRQNQMNDRGGFGSGGPRRRGIGSGFYRGPRRRRPPFDGRQSGKDQQHEEAENAESEGDQKVDGLAEELKEVAIVETPRSEEKHEEKVEERPKEENVADKPEDIASTPAVKESVSNGNTDEHEA